MTDLKEEIKIPRKFKKAQKKATRAYIKAAFFFLFMILVEVFFPRYRDFNTVRRTTITDVFGFFEPVNEIPWLSQISLLYSLIFLGLVAFLPTALKALKLTYDSNTESKQLNKLKKYHARIDYVYYTALLGFVLVLMNTFFISVAQVSGASMEPLFLDQDDVLIFHQMNDLSRGDVVVVKDPDRDNVYIVKRIIGLPGETIEIRNGQVFINDVFLPEDYVPMGFSTSCHAFEYCRVDLTDSEFYLIGDNRINSNDSRRMGPFTKDDFLGEVVFIIRPFDRLGRVQP